VSDAMAPDPEASGSGSASASASPGMGSGVGSPSLWRSRRLQVTLLARRTDARSRLRQRTCEVRARARQLRASDPRSRTPRLRESCDVWLRRDLIPFEPPRMCGPLEPYRVALYCDLIAV
jgi:hypothetical protein